MKRSSRRFHTGVTVVAAALLTAVTALSAQEPRAKPELRPFVGASIPTGTQRDLFNDAPIFGLQGAVELKPTLHLVGTFGWVPGQNAYVLTRDNVNIFQYDVGLERSMVRPLGGNWQFRPYVGISGGAPTYAYQADQLGRSDLRSRVRYPGHGVPAGTNSRSGSRREMMCSASSRRWQARIPRRGTISDWLQASPFISADAQALTRSRSCYS